MSNVDQWGLVVGFLLPVVLAVVQQSHWSTGVRSLVAFLACVVAALGTIFFAGTLVFTGGNAKMIGSTVLLVLVTALSTYEAFWKPTGVAPTIEAATNLPHVQFVRDTPAAPPAA